MKITIKKFVLSLLICLLLCYENTHGQQIQGKWIELKHTEAITYPSINILEFDDSFIIQYDFDKKLDSSTYDLKDNIIDLKTTIKTFSFSKDNILKIYGKALYNGLDTILSNEFLRLEKTKSNLPIDYLENKTISITWSNYTNIINFENGLSQSEFKLSRFKFCDDVRLETLNEMQFISVFCENERSFVLPIKEIKLDSLTLYAPEFIEINGRISGGVTLKKK